VRRCSAPKITHWRPARPGETAAAEGQRGAAAVGRGRVPLPGWCSVLLPEAALSQKKQGSGWFVGDDETGVWIKGTLQGLRDALRCAGPVPVCAWLTQEPHHRCTATPTTSPHPAPAGRPFFPAKEPRSGPQISRGFARTRLSLPAGHELSLLCSARVRRPRASTIEDGQYVLANGRRGIRVVLARLRP
jgi:hypothetical protein